MGKHAKLAPSGSSRWMPCPGSIALCEQVPKKPTSDYAKEGTAAHEVGAMCLTNLQEAAEYVGTVITVEGTKFTVTEEMAEAVQVYLDTIRADLRENCSKKGTTFAVEKSFDLTWLCPDMFGTNDCSVFDKINKKLYVYDYKHGQGVLVDVEWNSQLLIYAIGALYEAWDIDDLLPVGNSVEEVEIVIVQPRIETDDGVARRWTIKTEDLLYWGLHVLKPSALRTKAPDAKLVAGDHCRFCDATAVCPEKIKTACALAKTDFENPIFPAPEDLKPEHIVELLEKIGMFSKWADDVATFAFLQMQRGVEIPGRKLVKKKSNRVWVEDADVESVLGDAAFTKKLVSPAQAEKIIKKNGGSPEAELEGLWEKPDTGLTMALESDRRAAVPCSAAIDFGGDTDIFN